MDAPPRLVDRGRRFSLRVRGARSSGVTLSACCDDTWLVFFWSGLRGCLIGAMLLERAESVTVPECELSFKSLRVDHDLVELNFPVPTSEPCWVALVLVALRLWCTVSQRCSSTDSPLSVRSFPLCRAVWKTPGQERVLTRWWLCRSTARYASPARCCSASASSAACSSYDSGKEWGSRLELWIGMWLSIVERNVAFGCKWC
jgi:hypothetical protein